MTERLLQYIWQHQYYNHRELISTGEVPEPCTIISPGTYNTNQGPDFLAGRVKIGERLWVGNIELHVRASEWFVHGHQFDHNYNNVILHVVWENDLKDQPFHLPVIELSDRVPRVLLQQYEEWMMGTANIPCSSAIASVNELVWTKWKETLVIERLQSKTKLILEYLQESKNHWEEVFWWMLARNFGVTVNKESFESVARSLSSTIIARHRSSLHQVEAMLFGQANLLGGKATGDYHALLKKEYRFLKKKYDLKPVFAPVHFLRMRPVNFPTIRLAQLAVLMIHTDHLFSRILTLTRLSELKKLFDITAGDFWHYHYRFGETSCYQPKNLGDQMIDTIIINTVVPMVFAYGQYHKDEILRDKAFHWLDLLEAEKNRITTRFYGFGIKSVNAFDTQSLYQLKTAYCDQKRCLECSVGNFILSGKDRSVNSVDQRTKQ